MNPLLTLKQRLLSEIKALFELKKTERLWHIPALASLCIGIPLFIGLYFTNLRSGIIACTAGLVILHLPTDNLLRRMRILLLCSFGFMISYAVGLLFSFDPVVSALAIGLYSVAASWVSLYLGLKPPGSFFFIMLAVIASCQPFNIQAVPEKIGLISLGSMSACLLALIYGLIMRKKNSSTQYVGFKPPSLFDQQSMLIESSILGFFIFISLLIGQLLQFNNPYWIPISCLAVMQGATAHQIWQRGIHRVIGTFLGLGMCWLILKISHTPLHICLSIMLLQFIVEMLIVRHYGLAIIFVTPLTILMTEVGSSLLQDPSSLISYRFIDICVGSLIGGIGGLLIHHQKIKTATLRKLRQVKLLPKY